MKKRILSCLLLTLMLAGALMLTSCSNKKEEAPDGMKSVTLAGEPFVLYVPKSWIDNRASGASSAYYNTVNNSPVIVSARYDTASAGEALSDYVDRLNAEYKSYPEYKADVEGAKSEATLGTKKAIKTSFAFEKSGDSITGESKRQVTVIQYRALSNGYVITLSFFCDTSALTDAQRETFKEICTEFVVKDKAEAPKNEKQTDDKTPAGMKIASNKDLEYVFYVSEAWIASPEDKLTNAYADESGKPNVSVTAVQPFDNSGTQTVQSLEQYFSKCEDMYKTQFSEYKRIGEPKESKVGGRRSLSYTYTVKQGEATYKLMQTIFAKDGNIYSVTYTALEGSFDGHLPEVERMLASFRFKY